MSKKRFRQKRKPWFRAFKQIVRVRYRKPKFTYLGDKPTTRSIILSNHVGAAAPLIFELYADFPIRMWGTWEMTMGLKSVYKYLTNVYYHQKRHWNIHRARMSCLFAAPFTNLYYKGMNLIPTYPDARFLKTVKTSLKAIRDDGDNIVIFPEDSHDGYFDELNKFYGGFVVFAQALLKHGVDVPIFVAYYKKRKHEFVFDKPILFSKLKERFNSREEIAGYLLDKCNALGNSDN
ncbi:MAG: hypothetical protein K2K39_02940 [Clostridia bacterium]|nr:hypothetical protein [Clostridia bacterium]